MHHSMIDTGDHTGLYFLLIRKRASLTNYCTSRRIYATLEEFVREDDNIVFGDRSGMTSSLHDLRHLIDVQIINSFRTLSSFESYLEDIDLLNVEHLRPGWDAYFMVGHE